MHMSMSISLQLPGHTGFRCEVWGGASERPLNLAYWLTFATWFDEKLFQAELSAITLLIARIQRVLIVAIAGWLFDPQCRISPLYWLPH